MKIISGGQTGVDRAALDVALELGLPCGGWCPRGRKAEDGVLPAQYPLVETTSEIYAERTAKNVRESDGTLVLLTGPPTGGTKLTIDMAAKQNKACLLVEFSNDAAATMIQDWIHQNQIKVLNVAGPRESQAPGVYAQAYTLLRQVLSIQQVI
jgi:hypothetical protein